MINPIRHFRNREILQVTEFLFSENTMNVPVRDIRDAIRPLRFIFWGGLICVLDFKVTEMSSSGGWQFDFLNDFVGMLMIVWGVTQLGKIDVHERYGKALSFVTVTRSSVDTRLQGSAVR